MRVRNCFPVQYFILIYILGDIIAYQNPKPEAERGTKAFLGHVVGKHENVHLSTPLEGESVAGTAVDWFA
jgi:hypothetical protein